MKKYFATIMAAVATLIAATASGACWITWIDEPKMPKSLIK